MKVRNFIAMIAITSFSVLAEPEYCNDFLEECESNYTPARPMSNEMKNAIISGAIGGIAVGVVHGVGTKIPHTTYKGKIRYSDGSVTKWKSKYYTDRVEIKIE